MDANIPCSESEGNISVEEEQQKKVPADDHPPVSTCVSGQGLPYAPVDWPNPGDIWGWRVGKRVNNFGFFRDRFLVAPKHLRPTISLGSRRAVTLYLQSNHPNADIDAFFSSFSWNIPAQRQHPNKVRHTPCSSSRLNPHRRKLQKLEPEKVVVIRRSGRQLAKFSTSKHKCDNTVIDLCSESEESDTSEPTKTASADFQKSIPHCVDAPSNNFVPSHSHENLPAQVSPAYFQKNSPQCVDSPSNNFVPSHSHENFPAQVSLADFQKNSPQCVHSPSNNFVPSHSLGNLQEQESPADFQKNSPQCVDAPSNNFVPSHTHGNLQAQQIPEDFDNVYLKYLTQPPPGCQLSTLPYRLTEDNVLARKKLSDILGMDLRALLSSKELITEIVFLSSKLRRDPTLIPAECSVLNLIDEIPAIIKDLEEMEADAGKSFADLEANIALATNLKSKLDESREKVDLLQTNINSESLFIQEFDDHITALQAQRAQITDAMEKIKKEIAQFTAKQRMVFECLPKVQQITDKVQLTDQSEWEMKKKAAARAQADILKKFAPLEGFSFSTTS